MSAETAAMADIDGRQMGVAVDIAVMADIDGGQVAVAVEGNLGNLCTADAGPQEVQTGTASVWVLQVEWRRVRQTRRLWR